MYQTARIPAMALSRSDRPVCITRLAMRPAKSFWKKLQLWRTTCQWLCQRIRLVVPGMTAFRRTATSIRIASGRSSRTTASMPSRSGQRCASAAWRSAASISPTNWPMKTGMVASSSATDRLVANMAAYQPRVWRMKCQ